MKLEQLAGNEALKRQLSAQAKGRGLSHAYLISGPAGSGKRTLSRLLAAAMVCTGEGEAPCGICPGCKKALGGIHPDIMVLGEEDKEITVGQARTVRSDAYIRPNEAPAKVYVLPHAHLLNPTGQNILLKLVEEGPAYARFLFLTPNPDLLLPTIRSRCETLRAGGEAEAEASAQGAVLASCFMGAASTLEALPFLVSLEKKSREELALLLEEAHNRLVVEASRQPKLLEAVDRLEPIRAASAFNISPGHLAGWIMAVL